MRRPRVATKYRKPRWNRSKACKTSPSTIRWRRDCQRPKGRCGSCSSSWPVGGALPPQTPALWLAADDADPAVRAAALAGLGAVIETADLPKLIARLAVTKDDQEAAALDNALREVCLRSEDREAVAGQLAAALPNGGRTGEGILAGFWRRSTSPRPPDPACGGATSLRLGLFWTLGPRLANRGLYRTHRWRHVTPSV